MTDKVPDWAKEMAAEVVSKIRQTQDDFVPDVWFHSMEERVANRLLSAYRRGVEDSAKVIQDFELPTDIPPGSEFVQDYEAATTDFSVFGAAAIRRLGEAE